MNKQKIIPCLWFDKLAEEAAEFYVSVFGNQSDVNTITRYPDEGREIHGMDAGTVLTVDFRLRNYRMVALNGGPHFTCNPSISFYVTCNTSDEVNNLWKQLSAGGTPLMPLDKYPFSERYGWIQDKYGVSWQLLFSDEESKFPIIPSFMFVNENCGRATEALNFYQSVFRNSEPGSIFKYGTNQPPDEEGTIMYGDFTLEGQLFATMDSAHNHDFTFNEAVSMMIECSTQDEIDYYWNRLTHYPNAEQCGWLKDKFGVSWQITYENMNDMLSDNDPDKVNRVMRALLSMKKPDISRIQQAFEG